METARRAEAMLRARGCEAVVSGAENREALRGADMVVIATPFAGVRDLLPPLAPALAGMVVIDVVNPLIRVSGQFTVEPVPEGSAAEAIQGLLPQSELVSAFKNESAKRLNDLDKPVAGDVVVCGDSARARVQVMALVERVPNYRAVDGGALVNARSIEAITALLLNLNRRHRALTSIRILGLPEAGDRDGLAAAGSD